MDGVMPDSTRNDATLVGACMYHNGEGSSNANRDGGSSRRRLHGLLDTQNQCTHSGKY
jgi:hypothetical protein